MAIISACAVGSLQLYLIVRSPDDAAFVHYYRADRHLIPVKGLLGLLQRLGHVVLVKLGHKMCPTSPFNAKSMVGLRRDIPTKLKAEKL